MYLKQVKESLPLLDTSGNPKDLKILSNIYRFINPQPKKISEIHSKAMTEENHLPSSDQQLELLSKLNLN